MAASDKVQLLVMLQYKICSFGGSGLLHSYYYITSLIVICDLLQSQCVVNASNHYSGPFQATTHVVVGGAGASLSDFTASKIQWSHFRDFDHGFGKLTAFNHSSLLFEYKKSRDGNVYDHFTISRDYRDVLACSVDNCPRTSLASWRSNTFRGGNR